MLRTRRVKAMKKLHDDVKTQPNNAIANAHFGFDVVSPTFNCINFLPQSLSEVFAFVVFFKFIEVYTFSGKMFRIVFFWMHFELTLNCLVEKYKRLKGFLF